MSENVSEALLRKIQALMAKTVEAGCSEAEASAAADKVQELLSAYNLDLSVLEAGGQKSESREKSDYVGKAMYEYQRGLMNAIVYTNFCLHYLTTRSIVRPNGKPAVLKSYVIVGRKANVTATRQMFEYLNSVIEKEVPVPNTERMSRFAMSWKKGCSDRLQSRLYQRKTEREREAKKAEDARRAANPSSGSALTIVDVYSSERDANMDALYGEGYSARMRARRKSEDELEAERQAALAAEAARRAALTPRQRELEDEKIARQAERDSAKWDRRQRAREERTDWDGYSAGQAKGSEIGLDDQIGVDKARTAIAGGK